MHCPPLHWVCSWLVALWHSPPPWRLARPCVRTWLTLLAAFCIFRPSPTRAYLLGPRPEIAEAPLHLLLQRSRPTKNGGIALPPALDLYKLGRLSHMDVISGELARSRNRSNCLFRTEVTSLIEDVGTGHHTAVLLWAHHLAHLARSPVTVFFTTRCSLLYGSLDVIRTTVEYDYVSRNKVTLRSPPEVALTLHRCRGGAARSELEWDAHASALVTSKGALSSNLKTVEASISVFGSGW